MKCPVCLIHYSSAQDNSDILFNGACSECLESKDAYYRESPHLTERQARNEGLRIIDFNEEE